jgi:L-rhamnose isomerase/sugar isomerase
MALQTLKQAFTTDVSPILAVARQRAAGAIDPVACYRASRYRICKDEERPADARRAAGIV